MASSFPAESVQTLSGTITAWLPISTPWVSIAACSSQIYAQRAGLGGNLIAFDPLYGESIVPTAIPCLPSEVTSSWYQSNTETTTVLGPTFVCPAAYSAVQTILVNSLTQQVLCCPSSYKLNVPLTGKAKFPSQCTSLLIPGQTLTYQSTTPAGPWGIATTTVVESTAVSTGPTIVYGMHVNGFNVLSVPTLMPSTSNSPTSESLLTSSAPMSTSLPANTSNEKSSLSKGAAAGVGIGVVAAVAAAIMVAWLLVRRRKKRKEAQLSPPMDADRSQPAFEADGKMNGQQSVHEMPATTNMVPGLHEMNAT
ncbi:uncharacterized protein BP5553_07474 [Venustampulla echinocandica]|uniref:Uncharacterized protein n=1 Tax=Venustampulla echinocandica TaxID=2656787 RepID=A0A370TGL9_9HELO|nr:uncharacterized protein BP5553_07474 [Venustampulla echinocandica]RDL34346.1 hypothetical protein BP5553_07474 [Venustampulla echinocandica]